MKTMHLQNACARRRVCGVAVEYRLAPEHPYPAPLEDCYAGLNGWCPTQQNSRLILTALPSWVQAPGGGLAAGLGLLARDRKEIKVAYQVLVYPMIDDTNIKSAKAAKTDHYVWSRANNLAGWQAYLGKKFGAANVPIYAAPMRAKNLAGITADLFVRRRYGFISARRLSLCAQIGGSRRSTRLTYLSRCFSWLRWPRADSRDSAASEQGRCPCAAPGVENAGVIRK